MAKSIVSGGDQPVSFAARLASSDAFKALFREGMGLVEESAAYLDGPGRDEARAVSRQEQLAYASESMRLTTRLMQLAAWLLLQRAINDGEISADQAMSEKRKVKLSFQDVATAQELFVRLPERLRDLVTQSLRLQARIIHLDQLLHTADEAVPPAPADNGVAAQLQRLQAAFG